MAGAGCFAMIAINLLGGSPTFAQGTDKVRWSTLAAPVFRPIAYSEGQLFDADQGLPFTEMPTSFAEDDQGFLWVGTQNGLERWDGYSFRTFSSTSHKSGELPDNWIDVLHVDAQGQLWIGTQAGGLARYDRNNDQFVTLPIGPSGLSGRWIFSIVDDGAGGMWVGTSNGLNWVSADGNRVVQYIHRGNDEKTPSDDFVRALIRDNSGALWVGTRKGLLHRDPKTGIFEVIDLPSASAAPAQVRTLFQSSDGHIWIGTRRDGAYVIAPGSLVAEPLAGRGADAQAFRTLEILSASQTRAGDIWLGTYGQGILAINPATLAMRWIVHNPLVPSSLPDDAVWALEADRSGLIWVGSGHGVSYYRLQDAVETVFLANAAEGIASSDVDAMTAMPDGEIALATGHNGFATVDAAASRIRRYSRDPSKPETLFPRDVVTAFAAADDGTLFIGTRLGLYVASPSRRLIFRLTIDDNDPAAPVWSLLCVQDSLWVGGPQGVFRLSRQIGSTRLADRWKVIDHLAVPQVAAISQAAAGSIWFGTASGLFHFDPRARALRSQAFESSGKSLFVTSLLTDREGHLWIGTNGQGVYSASPSTSGDGQLKTRLHIDEGLPNRGINALLQDTVGGIWVSTNNGLAEINPRDGTVQTIDRGDGLAISSYWLGSAINTPQGELLFGGQGGFTIVRPDRFRRSSYAPPIVITAIAVENVLIPAGKFNDQRQRNTLQLQPPAKSFAVDFSALDYLAPDRIQYAYRLDGYDRAWIRVHADRRTAAYTNLPPGRYLLRVRSTNHAGGWSKVELALPIVVAAAWYESAWFRLIEAVLAVALTWMIVQARTVVLRARQRELQSLVDRRTAELKSANDRRRALIENVAHDLRTPLTSLSGYLETLEINNPTLSNDDRQKYLSIAVRQSGRLTRLVRELFDLVRLEEMDIKLSLEPIQLGELAQERHTQI